jgi:rubrerythrin
MYNPYDQISIEETIPVDYEQWLDEINADENAVVYNESYNTECPKCGESITRFEMKINDDRCPCCDSLLAETDVPI